MTRLLPALLIATALGACTAPTPPGPVTTRNSELTHGNVQLKLAVGETTQAEVLDVFGAPNVTTIDGSGQEVWTYQRAATVQQDRSSYNFWTIILAGSDNSATGFERTQRTTTLIIKFDDADTVSDFRSRSSNF